MRSGPRPGRPSRRPTLSGAGDKVSLGIADTFTSVDPGSVFLYYDHLEVEVIPEPAALSLLGLAGVALLRRR